jgi:putative ABC transport system ATP-binding protein
VIKAIIAEKLTKVFRLPDIEIKVLGGVDFSVDTGEFISIMGPSGSGKTTLMNILGCLDTPTTGNYLLEETDITHYNKDQLSEIRNKKIGFIFQSFNLLPRASALDNVLLPLIYNANKNEDKRSLAINTLNSVGLSDGIHHLPSQLSGGQQQRVAIARALINNPSIILADEPTGNLDSKTSYEILEILKHLNRDGRTIVMITHDKKVASSADRILEIHDGEIIN